MEILAAVSMEKISGFSQSELAAESGVPLRLSEALCCRMEDLMER